MEKNFDYPSKLQKINELGGSINEKFRSPSGNPNYFVMRDSSLETDNVADIFEQIWQAYSKDTIRFFFE